MKAKLNGGGRRKYIGSRGRGRDRIRGRVSSATGQSTRRRRIDEPRSRLVNVQEGSDKVHGVLFIYILVGSERSRNE